MRRLIATLAVAVVLTGIYAPPASAAGFGGSRDAKPMALICYVLPYMC